jgi:hypothetical protein
MKIGESDEQPPNAAATMGLSFEPDSNVTREADQHPCKQYSPSRSTEQGMPIDDSDKQSWSVEGWMKQQSEIHWTQARQGTNGDEHGGHRPCELRMAMNNWEMVKARWTSPRSRFECAGVTRETVGETGSTNPFN